MNCSCPALHLIAVMHEITAGEEWSDGGRVHVQEKTTRDYNALLCVTQHAAVQEENRTAGATTGIHAGAGVHTAV